MKDKTLKLYKNNDHKDWTDGEWINEFYEFLQGNIPEGIILSQELKLSPKQAYCVLWYLREHFSILPDRFTKCDVCDELFDDWSEGIYSESGNEHGHNFCGSCDYLAPYEGEFE